ncbi:helix-turn-helix domain-containing protein [Algibacter lectus]|uniref:Type III secretion thermoregulatory protein n=1 Tax=Algibacter lectus TaxID=221126 RepID=A0A090VG51_9FLAO|nr:AraC family transcriptional regulator [Algibacter lectus]GAL63741.1 type III secretion thermoregulatory protein [Algibacter lectus]SFB91649.1 AraC-type DNA-binding protein [Algibacter lectus]
MDIKSCYIGPEISPEQFIPEHFFLFLIKGTLNGYDGSKIATLKSGDYCIARKNHLSRYNKLKENDEFEKVVVVFDELFLRQFQEKHTPNVEKHSFTDAFLTLAKNKQIPNFINSLMPHYNGTGKIETAFQDIKREELLFILLKMQPELSGVFFDYGKPQKINLEEFMHQNYKFNVSLNRFAFLTGRSLSAFKRDFKQIFNNTPNRWLVQKRLQEAYFLIEKKKKKPSEIYVDLGFENLSHFSFAFKKQFGMSPKSLL